MTWLLAFLISFVFVSAKAFQQLSVQHDRYLWIPPVSLVMALMEVCGIWLVVKSDSFLIFLPLGLGGASGCWLAMYLHRRLRNDVPDRRNNPKSVDDAQGIQINGDLDHEWR